MADNKLQTLVDLFNQHSKSSVLPVKKCSELKERKQYVIHYLKKLDTSVGDAITAALSEAPFKENDLPKFQVYLPKRFVTLLQNEDVEAIEAGKLCLISLGQTGNNSTELKLNLL
jgi:hypothetical protein